MDSGAQRSVVVLKQVQALVEQNGIQIRRDGIKVKFKFDDIICLSVGYMSFPLATPSGIIMLGTNVVKADVLLSIALVFVDEHN